MYAVAYKPKVLSGGVGCSFMAGPWQVLSYHATREEAAVAFSAEENRWMWDNASAYGAAIFEEQDGALRHFDSYGHHTLPLPAAARDTPRRGPAGPEGGQKMTHYEEVGAPAALEALRLRGLPVDTPAARSVAEDYLVDAGHPPDAAAYAVTRAYLDQAPPVPQEGPCAVCGEPDCDHNDGAGDFLCPDHWDGYR